MVAHILYRVSHQSARPVFFIVLSLCIVIYGSRCYPWMWQREKIYCSPAYKRTKELVVFVFLDVTGNARNQAYKTFACDHSSQKWQNQ